MRYCKLIISIFIILLISIAVHAMAASIPLMIPYSGTIALKDGTLINGTGQFKFAIVNSGCVDDKEATPCTASWTNDGSKTDGSEPTNFVNIPVSNGNFTVKLGDTGDTSLTNMSFHLLGAYFTSGDTYLRIWFRDDISKEFELLPPDRQLVSVPYAYRSETADTVAGEGVVSTLQISDSAITQAKIATGAVGSAQISDGSVASGDVGFNYAGSASKGGAASDLSCTACVSQTELAFSITGDITGVAAGTGLTGGGTSGDVTLSISTDGVDTPHIKDGAVTSAKIAAGAVGTTQIADGTVTAAKINSTGLDADTVDGQHAAAFVSKAGDTMTGGLTLPSLTYSPAKSASITYAAISFSPATQTVTYSKQYNSNGYVYVTSAGSGTFIAPVTLPAGVTITGIESIIYDGIATGHIEVSLRKNYWPESGTSILTTIKQLYTTDSEVPNTKKLSDLTLNEVIIEGPETSYWIDVYISTNSGTLGFFSVTLRYKYISP